MSFLHGDLKEKILVEISKLMEVDEEDCISLKKKTHESSSECQAIQYQMVEELESSGYIGSQVDSWSKKISLGVVFMVTYADDFLTTGIILEVIEPFEIRLCSENWGLIDQLFKLQDC